MTQLFRRLLGREQATHETVEQNTDPQVQPTHKATPAMQPSRYQQAIFDFVTHGRGHGVVSAVPGSGKTTTLLEAAGLLDVQRTLFVAFSKAIATELQHKLARRGSPMRAQTIHSLGNATIRKTLDRPMIDDGKYTRLAEAWLLDYRVSPQEYRRPLAQLVGLAQLTCTQPTDMQALADLMTRHGIVVAEPMILLDAVLPVLQRGMETAQQTIDFNDMVWLPWAMGLKLQPFDYIFVDECQDLNRAQLEFILRCVGGDGRLLFVGDPHQAIFGFAGADNASVATITQRTGATELLLSICYRCPTSHIKLAAEVYAGIEAAPGAKRGEVISITQRQMAQHVKAGDMIICRCTAPLVAAALALVRAGVPAQVQGRDIGDEVINMLRGFGRLPGFRYESLLTYLERYREDRFALLLQRNAPGTAIEALHDRVNTLIEIYSNSSPRPTILNDLIAYVEYLFAGGEGSIILTTIHRAKGLERERVFLLLPDLLPHPSATQEWEKIQENNPKYVALTRAKSTLFLVYPDTKN